ncbi:WAT1-related protein At1g25270-like [Syzygium oleosum]|uniref:WAT1-related protein At1g25270-like n=1 Tax=Syzygium oleosum TaxID=219896 RepID=UPI0024BAAE4F|nr:WAT1-related protein At1g25270-like [Syzygium oleosum]
MAMYRLSEAVHKTEALLVMVVVQVAFAGVTILYKLAASNGMNLMLVIAYRFIFATVFMAPLAFFLERKSRPKITWTVLVQAFFCGLFGGSMGQNLYLASLSMTSATYVSAMANLTPAVTFVLAISFGLEKARLRTVAGKAKVAGTLMGIGGAMLLTFYKGVELNLWSTHVNLLRHVGATQQGQEGSSNLPLGSLLAVASCFFYALWLIIQAKMSEGFPCQYTSTALMTFMASIQAVVYALCRERDWSQWKLGWNIGLLIVSYLGVVGSGLCYTLMAWCVRVRGPVFVSVFNPLMLVTVALAGSMVLDEKLNLGSILGSGLIVLGLYAVLWGKRKENKKMNQLVPSSSPNESESIEIVVASPNKNDIKEGDDVQELAQKESDVIQESFEGKRGGGGEQA